MYALNLFSHTYLFSNYTSSDQSHNKIITIIVSVLIIVVIFTIFHFVKEKREKTDSSNKDKHFTPPKRNPSHSNSDNKFTPPKRNPSHSNNYNDMLSLEKQNEIDNNIKLLQRELKRPPYDDYTFSSTTITKLRSFLQIKSNENHEIINQIVKEIILHIGMIVDWLDVNVYYDDTVNNASSTAGTYNETNFLRGKLNIVIKPNYNEEMLLSIICHECAHHFLNKRRVKLDQTQQNEVLTDIATAYLGFGAYMYKGYDRKQTIVDNYFISTTKVGYLNRVEMRYAYNEIRKLQASESIRKEIVADLKLKIKNNFVKTENIINTYQSRLKKINISKLVFNKHGYYKFIANDSFKLHVNNFEKMKKKVDNQKLTVDDIKQLQIDLNQFNKNINKYIIALKKLSVLNEFQMNLSSDAIQSLNKTHIDAMNNNAHALLILIKYYLSIPDFSDDASFFYNLLTNCNDGDGFYCLGECYYAGLVVEKNIEKAKYYFYNAKEFGSSVAKERLYNLAKTDTSFSDIPL